MIYGALRKSPPLPLQSYSVFSQLVEHNKWFIILIKIKKITLSDKFS